MFRIYSGLSLTFVATCSNLSTHNRHHIQRDENWTEESGLEQFMNWDFKISRYMTPRPSMHLMTLYANWPILSLPNSGGEGLTCNSRFNSQIFLGRNWREPFTTLQAIPVVASFSVTVSPAQDTQGYCATSALLWWRRVSRYCVLTFPVMVRAKATFLNPFIPNRLKT